MEDGQDEDENGQELPYHGLSEQGRHDEAGHVAKQVAGVIEGLHLQQPTEVADEVELAVADDEEGEEVGERAEDYDSQQQVTLAPPPQVNGSRWYVPSNRRRPRRRRRRR